MAWKAPARRSLLFAVAFTMAAGPARGQSFQRAPASLTSSQIAVTLRLDEFADRAARRDFRWPGATIGAIGLGIAGGITGAAYCGNSENGARSCTGTTIGFALGGAAIGAVLGYLLGRLIAR